ncbi:hypothetical protein [Streptomyces virginiae]|uniref:Mce-associated membrane protein n=1 Tax=Streptomyces virginiae TaxID=1961 RepID=A0ABZ1TSP0_STRVG|nr:hypothetical protein [Streptomyces virginiae]
MAKRHPDPDGPAPDWRALLAALPDEEEEQPPGTSRRRWRRTRRRTARRQRAAAVTAVRARPVHPAALLLVVLLVLVLGVLARCGGRTGGDDRPPAAAAPSATPTAAPAPAAAPSVPADTGPDDVAAAWTRAYLTRDPLVDQTHWASVRRAAAWATEDLTRNLTELVSAGWGRQVSRGEATRVTGVAVRPAGLDLPPDNQAQVWRIAAAEVDVAGDDSSRRTDTLRVELTRTTAGWRVSRVLGV